MIPNTLERDIRLLERLSFSDLDAQADDYDRAVTRTADIDRFCSSSVWVLPAARHLSPESISQVAVRDGAFVALAESLDRRGHSYLLPLEAAWGLSSPLVGADEEAAVELFLELVGSATRWRCALVTGLVKNSALWGSLSRGAARIYPLREGPETRRYVANLSSGAEGFLARRSPGFRKNLRRAERRAARRGVVFEVEDDNSDPRATFARLLDVERRSWKGRSGVGIDREPMCAFYREMQHRLYRRSALRLTFARIDGTDVAYVLGGVFLDTYRGLQFSYDEAHAALSLGTLCQWHEIRRLAESGIARYDLGTEVRYKGRWGEQLVTTHSLVLYR